MAIRVRHMDPTESLRVAYQTGVWSVAAQRKLIEEQRRFQAGQAAAGRRFQAQQAGLGRGLQREGWDRQTAEAEAAREALGVREEARQEAITGRQTAQQEAIAGRQRTLYEDLMPGLQEQEATRQLEAEAAEREREREEEWFDQLRRKYPREFDEAARAIGAVLGEEGLGEEATENALGQLRAKYPVIDDTAWDMLVRQRGQMGEAKLPYADWAPSEEAPLPPNHYRSDEGALFWVNPETGESVLKMKAPDPPKPVHTPLKTLDFYKIAEAEYKQKVDIYKDLLDRQTPEERKKFGLGHPGELKDYQAWRVPQLMAEEEARRPGPAAAPSGPEELTDEDKIEELKRLAVQGNKSAQETLRQLGISWQ